MVERHVALLVDAGLISLEFSTGCSPPPRFQRAIPSPTRTHRPVPVVCGALTHSVKALDISLKIDTELALEVGKRTKRA
ncbi:hypothetical protein OROHE_002234 [Orobanche hederae]